MFVVQAKDDAAKSAQEVTETRPLSFLRPGFATRSVSKHRTCRSVQSSFHTTRLTGTTWLTFLFALHTLASLGASHLPDAALKIGTLQINQNAQFTTNTSVLLSVKGVNLGSSSSMQFSNDGQVWSAPEPYKTSRLWQLTEGGYPPRMNTVLKTVYVRFRSGTGAWTRAVTDSIILARTSADVPNVKEVWITQARPANYSSLQPLGSARNPHVVPRTTNEFAFDSLMHSLMTNFSSYYPAATGTNVLSSATKATTLTLRIGPGVYETHGDATEGGQTLAWAPRHGWRIVGSGKNKTTLKAVHLRPGQTRSVIGCYSTGIKGVGAYHNFEISDLTIDANLHEGETNYQMRAAMCMGFVGSNVQVRRVKAKNAGTTIGGWEVMHIQMHNFGADMDGTHNLILEDCDIVQAQVGNAYKSGMISICGHYGSSGQMHYYNNVVVRNCYIDGAGHDGNLPVNRALYGVWDRGRFGVGIGGARNALVEDNLVMNVGTGYYIDSISLHDLKVRNNHFRNVAFGFDMQLFESFALTNRLIDTLSFEGNLVELDPRLFPVKDTWGTIGRRYGFRTLGNQQGPREYGFNSIVLRENTFRFTDGAAPEPSVIGHCGSFQGVRTAQVISNAFNGPLLPWTWENQDAYLATQADILDSTQPPPVTASGNTWQDGSICEPYPYVLDTSLPRPTVIAGQEVVFDTPSIHGAPATVAWGMPAESPIGSDGKFRWRTTPSDAGVYVVSFYANSERRSDPRRTLITVLPAYPVSDPRWFSAGLSGYWKLDEPQGPTLADSSGSGLHISAASSLAAGRVTLGLPGVAQGSSAVRLNAFATDFGQAFGIPNSAPHAVGALPTAYHPGVNDFTRTFHPFTLSFWFKVENSLSHAGMLAAFGGGFFCNVKPHPQNPALFAVGFGNWTMDLALTTATNLAAGTWHHVAAVYDGASARLFVNGQKAAEDSFGQLTGWGPNQTFWFGGGYGWKDFSGLYDEIALWNRALSPGEVLSIHDMQLAGVTPTIMALQPSNLDVTTTYDGSLLLSWLDNSSNEAGYLVERSADGANFTAVESLGRNASSYEDEPDISASYVYRIRATNSLTTSEYSNTNTPVIYHPVTNRLTLIAEGLGTLQPLNFTTNRLEIGQSYAVNASPAPGFVFAGWSDAGGTVLGTNHDLTFTMQPRMVLTATFIDIQAPQLRFAEPLANARLTNGYVNLRGTATDNARITNVWVSVNTAWFQPARSTNGWTNWFLAQQRLVPGTNVLRAYAHDDSGQSSRFATNKVFLSVKSPLTLQTLGKGSIRRAFIGNLLEIGRSYSARAIPATGYVFSNWVGSVTSPNASLSFLMQSNMTLQANFIPNPFKTAKGRYYGLFSAGARAHDRSGAFSLSLTKGGSYSGSARIGTTYYRFAGKLDVAGNATNTVPRPGTNSLTIKLNVNLTPGIDQLTGSVSDGMWTASLLAHRAVFSAISNPARAYAGKYTVIVPGAVSTTLPRGNGFGAVSITTSGSVRLKGYLADDSPITQSSYISRDGLWPLYVPLYAGKGSICGWMSFDTNQPPDDLHGVISWIKPAVAGAKYYPSGFTRSVTAEGSRFYPAAYPGQLLSISNGVVRIEGGELAAPFSTAIALGKTGFPSTNGLTLRLITTDGTFSGKFVMPDKSRTNILKGALFQNLNCGYGYLLGTNKTGEVFLSP